MAGERRENTASVQLEMFSVTERLQLLNIKAQLPSVNPPAAAQTRRIRLSVLTGLCESSVGDSTGAAVKNLDWWAVRGLLSQEAVLRVCREDVRFVAPCWSECWSPSGLPTQS